MPTDPILTINLCFEAFYPTAKEEVPTQAELFLNELELEKLTNEQQVLKLDEVMTCKKTELKTMDGSVLS